MSADERREQVIRAAVAEFAIRGLEGTSTGDIAKRVGVSQPYLFRLFPTKRDLFIAAVRRGVERIRTEFSRAAEGKYGPEALAAMGEAYQDLLLADSELLGMQMQQFAACHDPEVQAAVRHNMQELWQHVENVTGAPIEVRVDFFAKGMLCNMIAAVGGVADGDSESDAPMWQPIIAVLRDDVTPNSETDDEVEAEVNAEAEASSVTEAAHDDASCSSETGYEAYVERALAGSRQT